MVLMYMQRKVHSTNKSNDENTKVNGNIILMTLIWKITEMCGKVTDLNFSELCLYMCLVVVTRSL